MFKTYIPNETLLFPPCVGDLIKEDSEVRLISDIVEQLDITDIINTYSSSEDGQPPYHPLMMLKVVLYGYMCNIFSSRGLENDMKRDVHMIWLSSWQFPDHTTINRFKLRCMPYIKNVFGQLVLILVDKGEIDLSKELYIDGTTIRSRAARHKIKWRKNAEKFGAQANEDLQEAIKDLLEQVENSIDLEEPIQVHVDRTPDDARKIAEQIENQLGEKVNKKTKSKIRKVREAADRKAKHDETITACGDRCGVAPTDPECGIMHSKEDGYDGKPSPNQNLQTATQNQYITNYDTFNTPSDSSTALDFIETCIRENGVKPQAVVEDAGYGCEEVYVGLEKLEIEAVVKYPGYDRECSTRRPDPNQYSKNNFKLTEDGNGLTCPAGYVMRITRVETNYSKRGFRSDTTHFTCDHCTNCPFAPQCAVTKNKNNEIGRKLGNMRQERKAKERLDRPINQARLKRRSLEPEPVFGQLKHNHRYNRFRHFGKAKVDMDLGFELMALNILKLHKNMKKRV